MTTHEPRRRCTATLAIVLGTLVALAYLGTCALGAHELGKAIARRDAAGHERLTAKVESAQPRVRARGGDPLEDPDAAEPELGLGTEGAVPDAVPDDVPGTAPDPAPRPSAPPAVPATWGQADERGAADAAAYFVDLSTYVMTSGDTARWREVSDPACVQCADIADVVELLYRAGGRIEGAEMTLTSTDVSETDGVFAVRYRYRTGMTISLGPDGSALWFLDPATGEAVLRVRPAVVRGEAGWAIVDSGRPAGSPLDQDV